MDILNPKYFSTPFNEGYDYPTPTVLNIEIHNNMDYTQFLYENGIITDDEKKTIMDLITSPDKENYTVAKLILKNKSNGINIHTRKA